MSFQERLKTIFSSKISEVASVEIDKALGVLREYPEVREVRLFGSLQNGNWKPGKSDIDMAVFVESDNPAWSCFAIEVVSHEFIDGGRVPVDGETSIRRELRGKIRSVSGRVELHIATVEDLQHLRRRSKNFHKAMQNGRLLFRR